MTNFRLIEIKAFADDQKKKKNVNEKKKIFFEKVGEENILGKGENAGYQHFLSIQLFSKGHFFKVRTVWERVYASSWCMKQLCIKFISSNNQQNFKLELLFHLQKI